MFRNALVLMSSLLLAIPLAFANSTSAPLPSKDDYLEVEGGGFIFSFPNSGDCTSNCKKRDMAYSISFVRKQHVDSNVLVTVEFENPDPDGVPLVVEQVIKAGNNKAFVSSPELPGITPGKLYRVTVKLYADDTKERLLDTLTQNIQSPLTPPDTFRNLGIRVFGAPGEPSDPLPAHWAVDFGKEKFVAAYSRKRSAASTIVYIPRGQSLPDDWQEMLTDTYSGKPVTPEAFLQSFLANMKSKWPSFQYKVVTRTDRDIVFEWWQSETSGYGPEHEIRRLAVSPDQGMDTLAYVHKGGLMAPRLHKQWLDRIRNAKPL